MPGSSPKRAKRTTAIANRVAHPVLENFIAVDPKSLALIEQIKKIAASRATVLINGESGAGKELAATLLHYLGAEPAEPMVKIDCASLPEPLMESELFGYERGAFTGASAMKRGRLELAGAGTLVLDEVAALSPAMQTKLLRVIEEKRFDRLGGSDPVVLPRQLRIVAITSANLEQAVRERSFREDLFHRLNVVPLAVPPLRERRQDIAPLAEHFLKHFAALRNQKARAFSKEALHFFGAYSFPGNVRELRNFCERSVAAGRLGTISVDELPQAIRANAIRKPTLAQMERAYIADVLDYTRGKKSQAAAILGISRKNLLEKRKRYKLD
jgi:DNA-binding NtrC family response regulator